MLENVSSYKNTSVNYLRSQGQIMKLLDDRDIKETRFTNISHKSAIRAGFQMSEDTSAIMLEFFKPTQIVDGVVGTIPIRIIIPNIPDDEKKKNQAYRIFFWYLKTKFEAVDTGLIEFEQEFMPHIALGRGTGGGTMWQAFKEKMLPQIVSGEQAEIDLLPEPKKNEDENKT